MKRAEEILEGLDLESVFRQHFPDYVDHFKATKREDRAGTDYLVLCETGMYRIDLKLILQATPWKDSRRDCLPVEYYSVKEKGIRGYQGDADYIIWLYCDTLRSVCAERESLCEYIDDHQIEWSYFLEERETKSRLRSGYVYTSTFFRVPTWVIEGLQSRKAKTAA